MKLSTTLLIFIMYTVLVGFFWGLCRYIAFAMLGIMPTEYTDTTLIDVGLLGLSLMFVGMWFAIAFRLAGEAKSSDA